jgi:hypothetical protein
MQRYQPACHQQETAIQQMSRPVQQHHAAIVSSIENGKLRHCQLGVGALVAYCLGACRHVGKYKRDIFAYKPRSVGSTQNVRPRWPSALPGCHLREGHHRCCARAPDSPHHQLAWYPRPWRDADRPAQSAVEGGGAMPVPRTAWALQPQGGVQAPHLNPHTPQKNSHPPMASGSAGGPCHR